MKFSSTTVPHLRSDEELVVLCHDDRRVLVPLPATYEGAEDLAREEFGLDGPIQFETNGLAECDGLRVQIRWDTWRAASLLSALLFVRDVAMQRPGVGVEPQAQDVVGLNEPKMSLPRAQDRRDRLRLQVKREPQDELDNASSRVHVDSDSDAWQARSDKIHQRHRKPSRPSKPLTPESSVSSVDANDRPRLLPFLPKQEPLQIRISEAEASLPEMPDESEDEDVHMESAVEWSDEESEHHHHDSCTSVKIESEDEDDHVELCDKMVQTKEPEEDASCNSLGLKHIKAESPEVKLSGRGACTGHFGELGPALSISQERVSPLRRKPGSSNAKPRNRRSSGFEQPIPIFDSVQVKVEPTDPARILAPSVEVQVTYAGTRKAIWAPLHFTVDRFLRKACRQHNITDHLDRARLIIIEEDGQDDGPALVFRCEADSTMTKLGAKDGSEFKILLEEA
ncbi:hypothetical protein EUX98_g1712 [Antrodiella citrinella]|uniref:Uncharacterized protein n=1 Tax=Antrodiella citrinella TaxID=2447956 RepID=A0A4S4N3M0_9APHY|nr:hypothetical protein EUX98_g1712 [Antrodiella citrinella]